MGRTENTLSFANGILTDFSTKQPSDALELTKALASAAERVLSLPSELLQLKVNLTNQRTDLAEGQKKLQDALDSLSDEVRRKEDIEIEIALLEAQLALGLKQAEVEARLAGLDSVGERARLDELQQLLAEQVRTAAAELSLNRQTDELSGTPAETEALQNQVMLLNQQRLQQEAERNLAGVPEIDGLNREAAITEATNRKLEAELEEKRLRVEIRQRELELEELQQGLTGDEAGGE